MSGNSIRRRRSAKTDMNILRCILVTLVIVSFLIVDGSSQIVGSTSDGEFLTRLI